MADVPAAECAVDMKNIHKSFGKLKVLSGIDLSVRRGTTVALLGPNGAGKTTLVRIMTTLLRPDKGEVCIEGHDVVRDAPKVRSLIGLTGQYAAVDEYLTGRENLRMMGRLYHLSKEDTVRRTEELLEKFDLVDAADRYVRNYSGGMRRRLDLASSLIATPPILFLDEPTTALDPRSRLSMWLIIEELVRQGTTIFLTTQHLEEADRLADDIVVIDGGSVVARGTAEELKKTAGSERMQFAFTDTEIYRKALELLDGRIVKRDDKLKSIWITNSSSVYELKSILEMLEREEIEIAGLSCSRPSLDDVFLKLTGRKLSGSDMQAGGDGWNESG